MDRILSTTGRERSFDSSCVSQSTFGDRAVTQFTKEEVLADSFKAEFVKAFLQECAVPLRPAGKAMYQRTICFLEHAKRYEQLEVLKQALKDAKVDLDARGNCETTMLHSAVWKGYIPLVEFLLDAGADLEAKNSSGWTPLLQTVRFGHYASCIKMTRYLLAAGAEVDAIDNTGATALHFIARWNSLEALEAFLKAGARTDLIDDYGYTVFHYAARWGHLEVAERFMQEGGVLLSPKIINAVDKAGRTALYLAASNGSLSVVKVLVEAGADYQIANNEGNTPIQAAEKYGYQEVVEFLNKTLYQKTLL
tara:strand:- start:40740 stop:41663 length:924 start_codon:yes stop_codon:yes gene_type:complete